MKKINEQLRATAKQLLSDKQVDFVIGYANGSANTKTTPVFISNPEDVEQLIWNPLCAITLPTFMLDYRNTDKKAAVVVKGCDSRAINRLVNDRQLVRENVHVIGIPCAGVLDENKIADKIDPAAEITDFEDKGDSIVVKTSKGDVTFGKKEYLLGKCLVCEYHNPVVADTLIGDQVNMDTKNDFEEIKQLEAMSPEERNAYWEKQFERCIRCYACRNVCPACNCRKCIFDMTDPNWVGKGTNSAENHTFHITRAMHVAGRCTDCGECDRVCPMDIPLRKLNKKILKDMRELFAVETPGLKDAEDNPFGYYKSEDPEEFM